jgi:hypothetical protein
VWRELRFGPFDGKRTELRRAAFAQGTSYPRRVTTVRKSVSRKVHSPVLLKDSDVLSCYTLTLARKTWVPSMTANEKALSQVPSGQTWWVHDSQSQANGKAGQQKSLRTKEADAKRLLAVMNEPYRFAAFNLRMEKTHLQMSNPEITKRTWQDVMEAAVQSKRGNTRTHQLLEHAPRRHSSSNTRQHIPRPRPLRRGRAIIQMSSTYRNRPNDSTRFSPNSLPQKNRPVPPRINTPLTRLVRQNIFHKPLDGFHLPRQTKTVQYTNGQYIEHYTDRLLNNRSAKKQ